MKTEQKKAVKQHVLVVDDQPANLTSLEQILQFDYQVTLAANGQACLDQVKNDPPDLILLDVDMPLMDGLSVCRVIKANPATSMIPVIFVSALSRLNERLAGYHAGADDYVSKPYDIDELLIKIRIALNNRHDLEVAREQSSLVQEAMEDSLAASTELSVLVRFIDDCLDCDDVRTLGEHMLDTFERFGLRVIVRMIASGHYLSHAGEVGVLDQEMMENMYEKGRIIDFGHRTLINAESVSVLIRNMPVHNHSHYQRWREHLNLLVEVVNSRINSLQRQCNKQKERERLLPLINGIHQLIEKLQHSEDMPYNEQAFLDLNRLRMTWESQQQ